MVESGWWIGWKGGGSDSRSQIAKGKGSRDGLPGRQAGRLRYGGATEWGKWIYDFGIYDLRGLEGSTAEDTE